MESLIQLIPNLITRVDSNDIEGYSYNTDSITDAIMANNFNKLSQMAFGFDYNSRFDKMSEKITSQISINDFISKIKSETTIEGAVLVGNYLEKVAKTVSLDSSSSSIVELIWIANITNQFGPNDNKMEEYLSDLLFSLSRSPIYKNTSPVQVRGKVLDILKDDLDKERAHNYLGMSYMKNNDVKDHTKWFDYNKFEEVKDIDKVDIQNNDDLINAIKTHSAGAYKSAIEYVKATYLNETEETQAGYCENDLVREYKASIIVATLAKEYNDKDFDKDNSIGFNLCARVQTIPAQLAETTSFFSMSNAITKYKEDAAKIVNQILGKQFAAEIPVEEQKSFRTVSTSSYIKKQLSTLNIFIDAKLKYYAQTLAQVKKYKARKSNFRTVEEYFSGLAKEFNIPLVNENDEGMEKAIDRVKTNADLLIAVIQEQITRATRLSKVFGDLKLNKVSKLNTDDLTFDKSIFGDMYILCENDDYYEKIITNFYHLVREDSALKGGYEKLRLKSPKFISADIKKRAKNNPSVNNELSSLLGGLTFKNSEQVKYIADSKYVNVDGTTNAEYQDFYTTLNKGTKDSKKKVVKENEYLSNEEKEELEILLH